MNASNELYVVKESTSRPEAGKKRTLTCASDQKERTYSTRLPRYVCCLAYERKRTQ